MRPSLVRDGDLESYGKIVLFGDSITQFSFDPAFFASGSALANTFTRRLDIVNRGFSGYTTDQALSLLPRIFPSRRDDVKLVFVFFGANDAVLPGFSQHVPLEQFVQNYRAILTSDPLRNKVIAVIPPPIEEYTHEPGFGLTRTAAVTKVYGDAIKNLCIELKVPYADVWTAFMTPLGWKAGDADLPGSKTLPFNKDLAAYFSDGLHPIGPGYRLIYQVFMDAIGKNFPELMPDLKNAHTPLWERAIAPKPGSMVRWVLDTRSWTSEKYLQLAQGAFADKFANFRFDKDRYMALGSELLQRRFIADVLGRDLSLSQVIPRDARNRPYFTHKAAREHDFNVSHHNGIVVLVGLIESGPIGVDITCLPPSEGDKSYFADFEDSFCAEEWKQIDSNGARFAQHWALKEAYVKATGTGIVVDLPKIKFSNVKYVGAQQPMQNQAATVAVTGEEGAKMWNFELHYMSGQYLAIASHCVAHQGPFLQQEF